MNLEKIRDRIGKSHLICGTAALDLEIVNFLDDSYYNNERVFDNPFLQMSSVMFYRSIVINLYSVFGDQSPNNKYSLKYFASIQSKWPDIDTKKQLSDIFERHKGDISIITQLRHKEFAHNDLPGNGSIKYNLDHIYSLNQLMGAAKQIFKILGELVDAEYWFEDHNHCLDGLKELIQPHI